MKILYGVQGTGNGHITRARALAPVLKEAGVEVDFVFSGRKVDDYFDMQLFGNYQSFTGLTLQIINGQLSYPATIFKNHPLQFLRDVRGLSTGSYDLVLTDFEPVTAWAARRYGSRVVGFGHQYAFRHRVPLDGDNAVGRLVFNQFAPAGESLGLHWHHFDQPILPPVIQPLKPAAEIDEQLIVVYLASVATEFLTGVFQQFPDYRFRVYAGVEVEQRHGNVSLQPFSREGFQADLKQCGGVVSNAGFALVSEVLSLGKKVLAIPLQGHMEQLSNAAALRQLNYAVTANTLTAEALQLCLDSVAAPRQHYPDTASLVVQRLLSGLSLTDMEWIESVWEQMAG